MAIWMRRCEKTKYVHEGKYVAEVEVVLMEEENGRGDLARAY